MKTALPTSLPKLDFFDENGVDHELLFRYNDDLNDIIRSAHSGKQIVIEAFKGGEIPLRARLRNASAQWTAGEEIEFVQELDDPLAKLALLLIALKRDSANELIDLSDRSEPNEIVHFEGSIHQDTDYYITNSLDSDSKIILRSRDEDLGSLTLDENYYLVGVTKVSNSGTVVRPLVIYSE